ncbi:MAG: hypothetical protein AAB074_00190 [Planctomycetota bacterium]
MPQKSGGCFKGCCIIAVILGVVGAIGVGVVALKWKGMLAWSITKQCIDPSDLTADEKTEARQLIDAYIEVTYGPKIGDPVYMQEFQKNISEMQMAAMDGKVEAREIRPSLIRIKSLVKAEGKAFPSALFQASFWTVRIEGFDESRRAEARAVIRKKLPTDAIADSMLNNLPNDVLEGVPEDEARKFQRELESAGCSVVVVPTQGAEAPPK